MRIESLINDDWRFHKGDIEVPMPKAKGPVYAQSKTERKLTGPAAYSYNDNSDSYDGGNGITAELWHRVSLPHDYIIEQDNSRDENNALGFFKYENAWYRRHFTLKPEYSKKRVLLRFDGVAGKSTVYLNGCLMHHNFSSYNTFEIDISDYVYFDRENVISVYINTEEFEGWWYQGGGIYRDVWLTVTEPVAIDLYGVYAPYKKTNENEWKIDFETTVLNTSFEGKSVTAESFLLDKCGKTVISSAANSVVPIRDKTVLYYSATVKNPLLWDCDNPHLYTVKTVLKSGDEVIDENTTRIGFRTVEVSPEEGLLINGKKTVIKGVCAHQDYGLTGLAVTENIARHKVKLIKEMGANAYRTSHYEQSAYYMDAFDETGFLVMDEARWFESTKEALNQLEALVKRDRNRPSVIFWSTGNEEPGFITDNGKNIHRAIAAHIRKFDKTRLITAAQDKSPEKSTIYDYCDVLGINYNLEIYDKVHEMQPEKAVFASECCATGTTRDWNYDSDENGRIKDRDSDTNYWFLGREKTWKFLMSRPYVIGGFQWAAVEHRGEAVWPRVCSVSGALDLFLQKKGAFYQNKSHWTDAPMAHIVPHWNFKGLDGEFVNVTVYTNCQELELFLNDKSLGRRQIEKYGHGEWDVEFIPGKLEVKGFIDGKEVCSDVRETTGRSAKLILTPQNDFTSNGKDIAVFNCECLDENGRVVPDACEFVTFSAASPAKIIGTGSDNCDHLSVKNTSRRMYMGKISVAVKPAKGQEELTLTAFSDNCKAASITVEF